MPEEQGLRKEMTPTTAEMTTVGMSATTGRQEQHESQQNRDSSDNRYSNYSRKSL
jgi:hypothetical protein